MGATKDPSARRLAAEMLDALKQLADALELNDGMDDEANEAYDNALRVIAKAERRQS